MRELTQAQFEQLKAELEGFQYRASRGVDEGPLQEFLLSWLKAQGPEAYSWARTRQGSAWLAGFAAGWRLRGC